MKAKITPTPPTSQEAHRQLTAEIWEMMMRCWDYNPKERPTAEEIISFLESLNVLDNRPPDSDDEITSTSVKAARSETMIDYGRMYGILDRVCTWIIPN
jgi:hypothetical protein